MRLFSILDCLCSSIQGSKRFGWNSNSGEGMCTGKGRALGKDSCVLQLKCLKLENSNEFCISPPTRVRLWTAHYIQIDACRTASHVSPAWALLYAIALNSNQHSGACGLSSISHVLCCHSNSCLCKKKPTNVRHLGRRTGRRPLNSPNPCLVYCSALHNYRYYYSPAAC